MSDDGWMLMGLDAKLAVRQGVPLAIPVPKSEFEKIADKGLEPAQMKKWIASFLAIAPSAWRNENAKLATSYDRFLAKFDLWTRAREAFAKNDFKTAISTLKLIANVDPEDLAAKMNLGSALASTGDNAGALKQLEAIRESFEGEADYHVTLGQVHIALAARDRAIDEMVLCLEADPSNQVAMNALKALGVLVAIYEDPRDAKTLSYVRADAVLEYLEGIWDAEARDAAYYVNQIVYHEAEQRPAVALRAAERALAGGASGEQQERAETARLSALRALGRIDDAVTAARDYLGRVPGAVAHVELAQCLIAAAKPEEATKEIEASLAMDPGNLLALDLRFWPVERGDIALIQNSVAPLRAFADLHATIPGVWRSLARAKLAVGSTDEALELFAKTVALAPDDDELRAEYWTELGRAQRFEDILADAAKVTNIGSRNWKMRWNEAEAYEQLGKKTEARAVFASINHDTTLHVDIRKRAKRAAGNVGQ